MGCSNWVTGTLNLVTFLISIPIIGLGAWLAHKHDTVCVRFLQYPVIAIGVFIMLISLAGMIGAWCDKKALLWIYLFVMFILIVLLFIFTIFAFVVTNAGAGQVVSGKGFKEYHLGDYSTWLQRKVDNSANWAKIKSCLSDAKVCSGLSQYTTVTDFNKATLTPLQSGCCKPPSDCGFTFVNATDWTGNASGATDTDCVKWSDDQTQLCFDCDSCRAGVLQNVKTNWRKVAIGNILLLVLLIIVYSCGCCALRNPSRGYQKGYQP